jgi:hypothetical protein
MNWTINQIDGRFDADQLVPDVAHWQCVHADGDYTGTVYGASALQGLQSTALTPQAVLEHVWANSVDKDATEQACIAQAAQQRAKAGALRLTGSVSTPTPTAPLDQAKAAALDQVDQHHETVVNELVGKPTQTEKDTWAMKLATAAAVKNGVPPDPAGRTFLETAQITDAKSWADVVLRKATAFACVVGVGEALRSAARQAINTAQTPEEVTNALEQAIEQTQQTVQAFRASQTD